MADGAAEISGVESETSSKPFMPSPTNDGISPCLSIDFGWGDIRLGCKSGETVAEETWLRGDPVGFAINVGTAIGEGPLLEVLRPAAVVGGRAEGVEPCDGANGTAP